MLETIEYWRHLLQIFFIVGSVLVVFFWLVVEGWNNFKALGQLVFWFLTGFTALVGLAWLVEKVFTPFFMWLF